MMKMSTRDATRGTADTELDLIDEYLMEKKAREQMIQPLKLPGPPPPPQDLELDELNVVARPKHSHAMLVPRGTGPQVPLSRSRLSISTSGMASSHSNLGGNMPSRRPQAGRGAAPAVAGRAAQPEQLETEFLEQFLEMPVLVIVEQPKERGMRFRYECEGRSAGSILGASSTESNKTLPTVEIKGCTPKIKRIKVTVSLVTKDIPHRPHPHSLVGKDCADGICVVRLNPCKSCRHSFSNLGIQCVRRKELEMALEKRRSQKIDPFNTGHSKSIEDIDMNVVRLCFQCEVETENEERILLNPVVTNAVYDKKATTTSELKINRLNVVRGPCTGKTEIYLLCDKVQKDDIEIIFSLGKWEAKAEFAQTDVHRQIAIVFKSPPYQEQDIREEVDVNVFLRRLSDHMDSEPVKFTYEPQNPDPYEVNRKRKLKSDIRFAERCSVAAQNETLPESPSPVLFGIHSLDPLDGPQPELMTSHLEMEEAPYPSNPQDVKAEENLISSLDLLDFGDQQAFLTGISQALGSSASGGFPLLSLLGIPEQGASQSYGFLNASFPGTFNQDPNSNYALPNMDLNCNMPGDSRMPDMNFYNDVRINHSGSQLANGTQPLPQPLPFDFLLEDLAGPTAQPIQPCDNEDPALGLCIKTESHIGL